MCVGPRVCALVCMCVLACVSVYAFVRVCVVRAFVYVGMCVLVNAHVHVCVHFLMTKVVCFYLLVLLCVYIRECVHWTDIIISRRDTKQNAVIKTVEDG